MENKKINIKELLQSDGKYVGTTMGVSMRPMIVSGRDVVVIEKKTARLKPLDVALYLRNGTDYVLHRVLKVTDSGYIIRGDNCYSDEIVKEDEVIGVLTQYFKKEKPIMMDDKKYLRYVKRRLFWYKPRRFFVKIKTKLRKIARRIIKGK
ncbi:MAG: S24/S26 family peptidase [Clostridia bacterium]|nr:S24/S26 family peptidase [Clostridia bacterium]